MVQKTKRNQKSHSHGRSRSRSRSRTQHIIRKMDEHEHEPIIEQHHFYSKMAYDGNTMVTESQKDDEPIQRRKYTLKQLEREIPIGAELIKTHLDHKVPLALNKPISKDVKFTSALPNPRDLGLLPPRIFTRRRHKHKPNKRDKENLRLLIEDHQYDDNNQPRNFFDLP